MACRCGPEALASKAVVFQVIGPEGDVPEGEHPSIYEARAHAAQLGPAYGVDPRTIRLDVPR